MYMFRPRPISADAGRSVSSVIAPEPSHLSCNVS